MSDLVNNELLRVDFKHTRDVDLLLFSNSFANLALHHKRFALLQGYKKSDISLILDSMRNGSKIVDIIWDTSKTLFNDSVIMKKYHEHLKKQFDLFIEQKFDTILKEKAGITIQELKELKSIYKLQANDYKSKTDCSLVQNGQIINNFNYTGTDANAVVDSINNISNR